MKIKMYFALLCVVVLEIQYYECTDLKETGKSIILFEIFLFALHLKFVEFVKLFCYQCGTLKFCAHTLYLLKKKTHI